MSFDILGFNGYNILDKTEDERSITLHIETQGSGTDELNALEQESKKNVEGTKTFADSKQISMLWGKAFGAGYKGRIKELMEVTSDLLGYKVTKMDEVEKKDVSKLAQFFDKQKQAS